MDEYIAFSTALNSRNRPPALWPLAYIKYAREIQPEKSEKGTFCLRLYKWGWEYKHRGKRLKTPPEVDVEGIREALGASLPQLHILQVVDQETYVMIFYKWRNVM